MQQSTRRLLVLHAETGFQMRLRRVTREGYTLELVPDWASLAHAVRSAAPGVVVVVDPHHGQEPQDGPAPALHGLLLAFPSVPVVATLDGRRRSMHDDILLLGAWGVAAMLDPVSETTVRGVFHRLENARIHTLRRVLETELAGRLGPRGEVVLDAALHVALERGHVRDLARRLHLSSDTLLRWCHAEGLPVPRRLLLWTRLLLAAHLLDDPGQSVQGAARASGYASDDALRRALLSVTGHTPTELREGGAYTSCILALRDEIAALPPSPSATS